MTEYIKKDRNSEHKEPEHRKGKRHRGKIYIMVSIVMIIIIIMAVIAVITVGTFAWKAATKHMDGTDSVTFQHHDNGYCIIHDADTNKSYLVIYGKDGGVTVID